ncbi:phosphoethanolamine--lipid A transferase [Shewanella schlegeliana]|uniref:Phosphoethanolamine--lipid A transferase n=1 Tax=Shewanella schlegeliana TaxID=190308 RepID=A0ABS1SU36_9GAMM|nr:phosphoethanolamine--lipid A transferase [Shewanella schlegeliana]MBL4912056.1 phosphoethanolamine--lipid A transferase [Shewanella schlegeliana]MCL1111347.1 phosphoethanolamine--lipid A transferase [Shewanella schlegeliana]GIU33105.1 phosphoethanolamine transferase [Shewanella schlegeliana]
MLTRLKNLNSIQFTFILSLYYVCVFNIPLFQIVKQGVDKQSDVNMVFIATMPFFLLFALCFLFSIFSFKYLTKPFFILLTLVSSSVFFAALQYGVVFDYGMIENTFQTNQSEAATYLNWASMVNFAMTGALPALLIYKVNIQYKPLPKELLHKALFMLSMLAGVVIIGLFYYQNYVSFGRNNDIMKRYIIPTYFIGSTVKYVDVNYLQEPLAYKQIGLDAKVTTEKAKPNLVVLVVGETARAQNYHYYGYNRDTNAYTSKQDLIVFKDTSSCGTATAVSLPCMFSRMGRDNYDARREKFQDSAIDVLNHAGIQLDWLDNDSGCKGVCQNIESITIDHDSDPKLCNGEYCYDQVLLNELDKRLKSIKQQDTLLVLHIIGSHGPTYYLRYPEQHRHFKPDCQRSDIQNCSHEELINTYDNTILYTDYILSQVVEKLKAEHTEFDTAMLYISDHGESLGENGMYLHGAPYSLAPDEQTKVPFLGWFSAGFAEQNHLSLTCLAKEAQKGGFSHDNLFDSLLGLMNVKTSIYRQDADIFSGCRK